MFRIKGKYFSYAGFVGLVGFIGIKYFFTNEPSDLFFFSFFAFFSFFILGDVNFELQDERWKENRNRAGYIAGMVALCFVFLLGFFASNALWSRDLIVGLACGGWVASLFTFAIAFRVLENR